MYSGSTADSLPCPNQTLCSFSANGHRQYFKPMTVMDRLKILKTRFCQSYWRPERITFLSIMPVFTFGKNPDGNQCKKQNELIVRSSFKGNQYTFRGDNSGKIVCLLYVKWSTLNGNNLLPAPWEQNNLLLSP